jgi:hypothetical protein
MVIHGPKFLKILLGVAVVAVLSTLAVAPGMATDTDKVIKKVPTSHKVVSL